MAASPPRRQRHRPSLYVSRAEVDRLLASAHKRSTARARAAALQRLAEDVARFAPWPALVASLLHDVQRLNTAP